MHVAGSLGAMWGSSERMAKDERRGRYEVPKGQLACSLFGRMHDRLLAHGGLRGKLQLQSLGQRSIDSFAGTVVEAPREIASFLNAVLALPPYLSKVRKRPVSQ